jgi:DNA-binding CsgD family transcriptional regulator
MTLALSGALDYAIDDVWQARAETPSPLSEQEAAVAKLVAAGHTNRQIAARLHLSERTVETLLRGIRKGLGLRSRAQLAAWSVERVATAIEDTQTPLTGREREIVRLVAEGHPNRQIAVDLDIAERTVEAHLDHVRDKLGLRSRPQIAAWWAAQQAPR